MPANSLPDPSLMFLYLCMVHSDYTKIDFKAVGAAVGLKDTAARMRHSRLKKLIESGMVDGKANLKPTEGATDAAGPMGTGAGAGDSTEEDEEMVSASASPQKKRKMATPKAKGKRGVEKSSKKKTAKAKGNGFKKEGGDEEDYDLMDEDMGDAPV
ncbi:hypothetical protein BJY00DRAFT_314394 [Aspergillus carlsbadensis]|nr:hypothetical protein BJY00DRAFT_314394 [Aspergillus carlsbadensis]